VVIERKTDDPMNVDSTQQAHLTIQIAPRACRSGAGETKSRQSEEIGEQHGERRKDSGLQRSKRNLKVGKYQERKRKNERKEREENEWRHFKTSSLFIA
jgi:hypothetical protein